MIPFISHSRSDKIMVLEMKTVICGEDQGMTRRGPENCRDGTDLNIEWCADNTNIQLSNFTEIGTSLNFVLKRKAGL